MILRLGALGLLLAMCSARPALGDDIRYLPGSACIYGDDAVYSTQYVNDWSELRHSGIESVASFMCPIPHDLLGDSHAVDIELKVYDGNNFLSIGCSLSRVELSNGTVDFGVSSDGTAGAFTGRDTLYFSDTTPDPAVEYAWFVHCNLPIQDSGCSGCGYSYITAMKITEVE